MSDKLDIMNVQGIDCYEKNGTVYLKLEAVARGLGFTQRQIKGDKEYISVRWETISRYLEEFGFPNKLGKDDYVPENIFYRLAMKAKNEVAERFQAKVADEIIPTIRKHGVYMTPEALEQAVCTPDFLFKVVKQLKTEHDERVRLAAENAEMKPKAEYLEKILQSDEALTVTQIAKDYDMGPAAFNQQLHELGVQYNVGGQWVLYQKYCGNGYTQSYTATYRDKQGDTQTKTYTKWTQTGRKFLYEILRKHDIFAGNGTRSVN